MALIQAVAVDNGISANASLVVNAGAGWAASVLGSRIIVLLMFRSAAVSISSVTDSASNAYVNNITSGQQTNYEGAIYSFPNAASVTSVTANFSSTDTRATMVVVEESGFNGAVDGTPNSFNSPGTASSFDSGSTTTTNASDVLYGLVANVSASGIVHTPTGSWVAITGTGITGGRHDNTADGDTTYVQRQVVAPGTYDSTGTMSASVYAALIVAFKASAAGGAPATYFFNSDCEM